MRGSAGGGGESGAVEPVEDMGLNNVRMDGGDDGGGASALTSGGAGGRRRRHGYTTLWIGQAKKCPNE